MKKPYQLQFQGPVDVGFLEALALVEDSRLFENEKKKKFSYELPSVFMSSCSVTFPPLPNINDSQFNMKHFYKAQTLSASHAAHVFISPEDGNLYKERYTRCRVSSER